MKNKKGQLVNGRTQAGYFAVGLVLYRDIVKLKKPIKIMMERGEVEFTHYIWVLCFNDLDISCKIKMLISGKRWTDPVIQKKNLDKYSTWASQARTKFGLPNPG